MSPRLSFYSEDPIIRPQMVLVKSGLLIVNRSHDSGMSGLNSEGGLNFRWSLLLNFTVLRTIKH